MKKMMLIHGPNLNKLGQRDPALYGRATLSDIEEDVSKKALQHGYEMIAFQSNHEGHLIDYIQEHAGECNALIINPGAFSHYSYALHDAIADSMLPAVEVHLSNIKEREPWRAHSVIAPACVHTIMGKKTEGYLEAIDYLAEHLSHDH